MAGSSAHPPSGSTGAPIEPWVTALVGTTVDGFQIGRIVRTDPLFVVLEASATNYPHRLTLNVLRPMHAGPDTEQCLVAAVAKAATLHHPNVARLIRSGTVGRDSRPYVVAEAGDCTLAERLEHSGAIDWREAMGIVAAAARGLAHAHEQAIVHGHVGPWDILLANKSSGRAAMVANFGLSSSLDSPDRTRQVANSVADAWYLAPEIFSQARDLDQLGDQYALGIVAYQLIAGQPPFVAKNLVQVLSRHATEPVPSLPASAGVPHALEEVIKRALAKSPPDRFSDLNQFANALERLVPPAAGAKPQPQPSREPGPVAVPYAGSPRVTVARPVHLPLDDTPVPMASPSPSTGTAVARPYKSATPARPEPVIGSTRPIPVATRSERRAPTHLDLDDETPYQAPPKVSPAADAGPARTMRLDPSSIPRPNAKERGQNTGRRSSTAPRRTAPMRPRSTGIIAGILPLVCGVAVALVSAVGLGQWLVKSEAGQLPELPTQAAVSAKPKRPKPTSLPQRPPPPPPAPKVQPAAEPEPMADPVPASEPKTPKPRTVPERLTSAEVAAGIRPAMPKVRSCIKGPVASTVKVSFMVTGKTGRVLRSDVKSGVASPEVKQCIASAIKTAARFAETTTTMWTDEHTFKLGK